MKHLSSWLTVLILGAVPLSAAALDYGPNRSLLAVESGASQLSGARASAASMDTAAKPDRAGATNTEGDASDALPATPPIAPVVSPGVSRASQPPSQSSKPLRKIAKPATAPSPASWQSLLPGSIQ